MSEPVPLFGEDFDRFRHFLAGGGAPAFISPERFCQAFGLSRQVLADRSHVDLSIIIRSPETDAVQSYLRQSSQAVQVAADTSGSVEKAVFWFMNYPLPAFNYKMPIDLVFGGRADDLMRYLASLQAGFSG
jgi:hypothetical protein